MPPMVAMVLDLLDERGPLTTSELAELRRIRHQSMAAAIAEIREDGYIEIRPHPNDGRKKLISLTPSGREAMRAEAATRESALAAVIDGLDEDDLDDLERATAIIDRVTGIADRAGRAPAS
jgi:DNA-binding MarR family transcriptional regulator